MKKLLKSKIFFELILILAIVISLIYYFYDQNNTVTLKIGNEEYVFKKDETDKNLNLITLNSDYNTVIKSVKNKESIKVNGKNLIFKENLGKLKLNKNVSIKIDIKYKNDKDYTSYKINVLPDDFLDYETEGKSTTNGDFYLTTYGSESGKGSYNYVFKLNNSGDVIFYRRVFKGTYIFKKENIKGTTYYSYLDYDNNEDKVNSLFILDEKYNVIKKVYNVDKNGEKIDINPHDYIIKDLDDYIFLSGNDALDDGNKSDFTIHEIKNNEIIWEYKTKDYETDFKEELVFHFNSFDLDKDGNILVSFRNVSKIICLDKDNGTLKYYIDGNTSKYLFSYQHSVINKNGKIYMFNNNAIGDKYSQNVGRNSSIVSFNYNEETKQIENYEKYNLNVFSVTMGSIFISDDNTFLIAYGKNLESNISNFEEIDSKTGNVLFKFKYDDSANATFRVYKF